MFDSIGSAFFLLFRAAVIYFIYKASREFASRSRCAKPKAYLYAIGISAFLAFMAAANLGTHVEDGDGLGGGERVVDYIPTEKEKNEQAVKAFIIIGIASLVGTSKGLKERDLTKG